jgi:23S rRNA (cytosine1962-C5)-methyltransferase
VQDPRGRFIGQGLLSPTSEIRLRLLERGDAAVDAAWWRQRIEAAAARRAGIDASAYRLVHSEGDGLPSLVVDRYDRWLVAQILSTGLETMRQQILDALVSLFQPEGILLRHDVPARRRERLPAGIEEVFGSVPREIEVREGSVRYLAAPWEGQKTGAFLDQRSNRLLAGEITRPGGRALDCFAYHGSFALHLAGRAASVIALDSSPGALERARANAALNGLGNIEWRAVDVFEGLRAMARAREQFDTIVLDPPAFAKRKTDLDRAYAGYKEINLRAMRLLAPGGRLFTASCSFHVGLPEFLAMLADAAADSGRRIARTAIRGQAGDHPVLLTVPETGYLTGAVLQADR